MGNKPNLSRLIFVCSMFIWNERFFGFLPACNHTKTRDSKYHLTCRGHACVCLWCVEAVTTQCHFACLDFVLFFPQNFFPFTAPIQAPHRLHYPPPSLSSCALIWFMHFLLSTQEPFSFNRKLKNCTRNWWTTKTFHFFGLFVYLKENMSFKKKTKQRSVLYPIYYIGSQWQIYFFLQNRQISQFLLLDDIKLPFILCFMLTTCRNVIRTG